MTSLQALLATDPSSLRLGSVVDAYKELRDIRLAMDKETELVAAVERKFKDHLIQNLEKSNEKGVFGLLYKAVHKTKRIPKIIDGDWTALHQHIYNTGEFDLLQKRLSDTAVMERIEAGIAVPGVETMLVSEISVTKI